MMISGRTDIINFVNQVLDPSNVSKGSIKPSNHQEIELSIINNFVHQSDLIPESSISGLTIDLNSKASKSIYNLFSATTTQQIANRVQISDFMAFSASTMAQINNEVSLSGFTIFSANTIQRINNIELITTEVPQIILSGVNPALVLDLSNGNMFNVVLDNTVTGSLSIDYTNKRIGVFYIYIKQSALSPITNPLVFIANKFQSEQTSFVLNPTASSTIRITGVLRGATINDILDIKISNIINTL